MRSQVQNQESAPKIRPRYKFDVSCQGSVPPAIRAFLESNSFEDAIRNAISIGGDSDTIACIAGGIAQAYYGGVPEAICWRVYEVLDEHLGGITKRFMMTYCPEAPERPSVQVKAGSIPVSGPIRTL